MTEQQVLTALQGKQKGSFIRIGWEKEIASAKARAKGNSVIKRVESSVRWGVAYKNIAAVIKKREANATSGGVSAPCVPQWWEWKVKNVIKMHSTKGSQYFSCAVLPKNNYTRVTYLLNGEAVSREFIQSSGLVNASEWNKTEDLTVFDVALNNLVFIR